MLTQRALIYCPRNEGPSRYRKLSIAGYHVRVDARKTTGHFVPGSIGALFDPGIVREVDGCKARGSRYPQVEGNLLLIAIAQQEGRLGNPGLDIPG